MDLPWADLAHLGSIQSNFCMAKRHEQGLQLCTEELAPSDGAAVMMQAKQT